MGALAMFQGLLGAVLLVATLAHAQDDRLYSYICLQAQDKLCLGISSSTDPAYNPNSLYYMQVKHRERVEIRREDHLRTRWSVFPTQGQLQLTNFTSLCMAKRLTTAATPGDLVLRPCDPSDSVQDWDLLSFVEAEADNGGTLRLKAFPSQCVTMMACERTKDGHCRQRTTNAFTGSSPMPGGQRGAYVKLMPCRNSLKAAQTWTQTVDCSVGCSPFMMEGPDNVCNPECANDACRWDNGACMTPAPTPPTPQPTESPTTTAPTFSPTKSPTTSRPSTSPTQRPTTAFPTPRPTNEPTIQGTRAPTTLAPTSLAPSTSPTEPTLSPTTTVAPSLPTVQPTQEPTLPPSNPRGGIDTNAPSQAPTKQNESLRSGGSGVGTRLWYVWLIIALIFLVILSLLCCLCICFPAKKKKKANEDEEHDDYERLSNGSGGININAKDVESQMPASGPVKRPNADVNVVQVEGNDEPARKKPVASIDGLQPQEEELVPEQALADPSETSTAMRQD